MALNSQHHVSVDQLNTVMQSFATKADARFVKVADLDEYTLTKATTADTGFLATYQLFKGDTAVGDKINIPKDFLVKSATLETCSTADTPVTGYVVGDKYIDFVINDKDGTGTGTHLYLLVSDLVDTYTAGNGIDITNNAIAVEVDSSNANGLSVGANGVALATATASTAGAMSAADKDKLDNADVTAYTAGNGIDITSHAVAGVVDSSNANGLSVGANGFALATATASTSGVGGSNGAFAATDKEKLDNITPATSAEIQEVCDNIWPVTP